MALKALVTSRISVLVNFFSWTLLLALSTRLTSYSVLLSLNRKPNCLSPNTPRLFTSLRTLVSRIFSKSLQIVSSRLTDVREDGSIRCFHGFCMDTTWACFHAGRKYCLRRTALEPFVCKVNALLSRCLRTLLGIPFGTETFPTFSPLMVCWTSEG